METIQKADPALRRSALRWVAAAFVVGLPLLGWGLPALTDWLVHHPPPRALELAAALFAALPMPLVVFGFHLVAIGRRVLASGRFPPPGLRVVRDTPLRSGDGARRSGYALVTAGALIAGLALALAVLLPFLLHRLALD